MKLTKIVFAIVFLLLLVIGGAAYYVLTNINSIVERVIETSGTEALQTSVNASGVDILLLEGKGGVGGLVVANPKGFSSEPLLALDNLVLQIDLSSLNKPVKVIKRISVGSTRVSAEQKGLTETNIGALLENLKRSSGGFSQQSQPSSSTNKKADDIRLMVEVLAFGETEISLTTEQYGSRQLTLPAYTQTNIGDKQGGLSPQALAEVIAKRILEKTEKAVKRGLREAAKDKVEEKLEEKVKEELSDKISEDDVRKLKDLFR